MANRQTGGKSGKRIKADHQNLEQNQFGLKEAYTVLQRDFLELKKAYIGNEQHLVGMQEQYFILQQVYEELQQNSQDQQAKLVEKLEKSYDAYNEKFMRVEELEEKLNKCNKNLEEINQHNENQVKAASLQDQINQINFQRQVFEEAVKKSLANVGLSLVTVSGNFEINILDYKKLKQLAWDKDDCSTTNTAAKSKKVAELEHENAFLQQTLLSLKDYLEKQRDELIRTTDMLQKKTEECLNLKKRIQRQGDKGNILVETKALERIVSGLSEMSDFVVELKKTICDQNSWIDMLVVEYRNEYRKSQLSKDDKNKTAVASVSSPKNKLPVLGTASQSGTSGCEQNSVSGRKNKSKKKTKNAGHKVNDKSSDNCSNAASGNTGRLPGNKTEHLGVVQISGEVGDERPEEFEDYIVVPSRERSAFERAEIANSTAHHLPSSFSSLQTETRVPINWEPKSLHHELRQLSSLSIGNRRKTWERFETDSPGQFPQGVVNDTSMQKQGATNNDMCPMCNNIFEKNCDLEKRRSHINSHFED